MMKYFSVFFLLVVVFSALLAPLIVNYDPYHIDLSKSLSRPSLSHPLGLDEDGRDLLSEIIYGSRVSLTVTFSVLFLSLLSGLFLGTWAGYWGGWLERLIMALADGVLAFPKFLMALALMAMWGGSALNLIFALSFSTWAGFARLVRGEIKHLKKKEFVLQALGSGASPAFLIWKHLWPSLFGLMAVHAIFQSSAVLIAESGLSFLGLGVSLENPSWGSLLGMGRAYIFSAPHIILFPGLTLFFFLLSLNYLGEFLRERFDPRS